MPHRASIQRLDLTDENLGELHFYKKRQDRAEEELEDRLARSVPIMVIHCEAHKECQEPIWFLRRNDAGHSFPPLEPSAAMEAVQTLIWLRKTFGSFALDSWCVLVPESRYGQWRPNFVGYTSPFLTDDKCYNAYTPLGLRTRLLTLNTYVQDGSFATGKPVRYMEKPDLNALVDFKQLQSSTKQIFITALATLTVNLCASDIFADGKIRTAIILIYEFLASRKWYITREPIVLFSYLALARHCDELDCIRLLQNVLLESLRTHIDWPETSNSICVVRSAQVKELPIWVSQIHQIHKAVQSTEYPVAKRRGTVKCLSTEYPSLHLALRMRFTNGGNKPYKVTK